MTSQAVQMHSHTAGVKSIPLDPPVIDDPEFFDVLESIGHLPPLLKGLRSLYS
jgi:hypothetical protein